MTSGRVNPNFRLEDQGISGLGHVHYNLLEPALIEAALKRSEGTLGQGGTFLVTTGKFTGRSPKDKHVVKTASVTDTIWWDNNRAMSEQGFDNLYADMLAHMKGKEYFVQDLIGGADPTYAINVRMVTELAWHNLFIRHLLRRPERAALDSFIADYTVINCPSFQANPERHDCRTETVIAMNFDKKLILIGGTEYAGENKKSVFTLLNYILPEKGVMPMHCSANHAIGNPVDSAVFFGLSGTGKTTLSADPSRTLIGDDEHGWSDRGTFNFEGGCYAKTIDLDQAKEPEIWDAIRTDALLENVVIKDGTNVHGVDFADTSKTPNGRVAYPLHHIANHEPSGSGSHPEACIFLTCDAFGVLPPVARLSAGQAMYHFISGFTAKVAGTERGIIEPVPTFSACFGGAFLPLHPSVYANLLQQKLQEHGTTAYLVNTGWSGGAALNSDGTARPRMDIPITRAVITAILDGSINDAEWCTDEYFGFEIPSAVRGVAPAVLNPSVAWKDKVSFDETSRKLCEMFVENFKQYEDGTSEDLTQYGPLVRGTKNRSLVEELVLSPRDPDEHIGWGMPILN